MSEAVASGPDAVSISLHGRVFYSIWQAIPQITGTIRPIQKGKQNKQQGYAFRGVDEVYSALNLLLDKFGVTIVPEVVDAHREQHASKSGGVLFKTVLRVRYHLYASDGTSISAVVEGEAMDSGDKSTQKALSMAYKYMAFQVFCIPTNEKIDTEEESPEVAAPAKEEKKAEPLPIWQQVAAIAKEYGFACGEKNAALWAFCDIVTGKKPAAKWDDADLTKIEAELAKAVAKPAALPAHEKPAMPEDDIPF